MPSLASNIRASVLEYGAAAITVVINLLIIRHLGAEQYGVYTYNLSVIALLSSVLGLGCFDQVFLREAARAQDTRPLTWAMFWQRGFGALLVLIGVCVYHLVFAGSKGENLGLLLIAWTTGVIFVKDTFRMPLVAAQQIGLAVLVGLIAYLAGWFARLAAIWLDAPMPTFLLIITFESVIGGASYFLVWRHRHHERVSRPGSWRLALDLSRRSWPLLVTAGAVASFMRIDQIILFHLVDARSTGIYGSMIWIMERMFFLSGLLMGSFFPYLAHVQATDPVGYARSLRAGYKVMGLTSVPVALACSLYPTEILRLFLGRDFSGGEAAFAVLMWALPFSFWGALNQRHLLIHNLLRTDMTFALLSAFVNLALNLLLIPRWGVMGAAVGAVAGHSLYFFLQWFLADLRPNNRYIVSSLALPLAAGAGAALATFALPVQGLPSLAVFLTLYTLFVLLACIFPISEDYATIGRHILRAGGIGR